MSARRNFSAALQQQVRTRAHYLCEYCHTSEQWQYVQFTIDHILPIAQGGTDTLDNLALACFYCNRRKTDKTTTTDPTTKRQVLLFNPRQNFWSDHFTWSADGLTIIGLTASGQATVTALNLNRERVINIRAADRAINRHPPINDPIQFLNNPSI